jgi:hypothetical protein
MQYLNRQMESKQLFTALVWKSDLQLKGRSLAATGQLIEVQYPWGRGNK